jgi:putative transferase (TIGR04331 family)
LAERFLITTADERSWSAQRPVVFLGEWCRRIDREQMWARLDSVVARPVRFDGADRVRVIAYVDALSRELLLELARQLNRLHGLSGSLRFWRMLLGHWIQRYTCLLFHRWQAVQQVLSEYQVSGTIVFTGSPVGLAGSDTAALIWASNEDQWNNMLIGTVLRELANAAIEYRALNRADEPSACATSLQSEKGSDRSGYDLTRIIDAVLGSLQRETDCLVISSYLPPLQSMLLSVRLREVPRLRQAPPVQPVAVNAELRAANSLAPGPHAGFPGYARSMLFQLLPTCYLEGFDSLRQQVERLDWPRRPRLIFTSNNFDTSEVFKLWAAQKVEAGSAYIIGQHGSNYGTASYCPSETECVETADAFITWGWRDDQAKCKPAFIFRTCGRARAQWDRHGGLLLIEACLPHLFEAWDPYPEFSSYQEDQFAFVAALPEQIRRLLTVRLHAEHKKKCWSEPERWRRRQPHVRLEDGTTALADLKSHSRLVVHSYDSTGILENLALNVPTLCFWRGGTNHLRASAVASYALLAQAGILHDTPESAANKAAQVWADVGSWWADATVQDARRKFCHEYARTIDAPIATLARLLLEVRPSGARGRDDANPDAELKRPPQSETGLRLP